MAKIVEMGFRADDAVSALKQQNGSFQDALDSLLSGSHFRGGGFGGRGGRAGGGSSDFRGRRDRTDDDSGGMPGK